MKELESTAQSFPKKQSEANCKITVSSFLSHILAFVYDLIWKIGSAGWRIFENHGCKKKPGPWFIQVVIISLVQWQRNDETKHSSRLSLTSKENEIGQREQKWGYGIWGEPRNLAFSLKHEKHSSGLSGFSSITSDSCKLRQRPDVWIKRQELL